MTPKQMREERLKIVAQCRAIAEKAEAGNRALSAEEQGAYDKAWADQEALKGRIEREEKLAGEEAALAASRGTVAGAQRADRGGEAPGGDEPQVISLGRDVRGEERSMRISGRTASPEYRQAYNAFLLGGLGAVGGGQAALQMDSDAGGGYVVAPQQFMAEVIRKLNDEVFVRQLARVLPPLTTAESLGAPSLDGDPADPTWTAEIDIGSEDEDMTFGKRELRPHPLAKFIKVSKTLERRAAIPVDQLVRERLGYKFAVTMESNYLVGDGALKPLGVFTASVDGINTDRDVATGNEATKITFAGLTNAKMALKAQYRRSKSLRWLFHRDAVKQIALLVDATGRPLWLPSMREGEPDRILNLPFVESEYAPSTFTSGKYVGILGDFSYYWIVDALTLSIQVLQELFAAKNQNGYIARWESDGMPVLSEAFARVKLG